MAALYRSMHASGEYPTVGTGNDQLGSRATDVLMDNDGNVLPGEGISVNICACQMPPHLVPFRLQHIFGHATGHGSRSGLIVWRHGEGPYVSDGIGGKLHARLGRSHGLVEPTKIMPKAEFDAALADTQCDWQIDENHSSNCKMGDY